MNNNVLTYAEYQKRLKELKTPEDIASFAQELIAPALAGNMTPEKKEDKPDEPRDEALEEPRKKRILLPKEKLYAIRKLQLVDANVISPWYDVVGNDTDAMVISLYAKGLTTRDISSYLKNMHGIEIAQPSISSITNKVFPLVKEWQTRSLSSCYPVVYLDGLHFKVRDAGKIVSKVAYIVLGINQYGQKEVLGIWVSESEGSKFWMHVINDMKNRGVDDILIACVDGLKGFPEAIKAIYPHADVQVCIAHQIRHTIMFIPHKDKKQFCDELKAIYTAMNEELGMDALKDMMERWPQYRSYLKSWETRWSDLIPFFGYPQPIRKMVYTTNAIENLNRQFRKVTKTTTIFPHDDALIKLLWLAQADITQGWVLTTRNLGKVMAQLNILFPDSVHFKIADPKPRDIHKASVRDRLLHHALHRQLSPFFAKTFISDSNSCQDGKGTHRALRRFRKFIGSVSENNIRTVWVFKCDIRKFFANIDHAILLDIAAKYIPDQDILDLISIIVRSFNSSVAGVGLPLGNLTSQLLVNIYMNEFDQFMKHRFKAKYYLLCLIKQIVPRVQIWSNRWSRWQCGSSVDPWHKARHKGK